MKKVIGRYRFLHDILICYALEEMLTLPRRVLGPDLIAVDTLHRQAFVLLFGSELDKRSMDIVKGRCRETRAWIDFRGLVWLGGWSGVGGLLWRHRGPICQNLDRCAGSRHAIAHGGIVGVGDGRGAEAIGRADAITG